MPLNYREDAKIADKANGKDIPRTVTVFLPLMISTGIGMSASAAVT